MTTFAAWTQGGFAGLVALCFGVLLYRQADNFDKLIAQHEVDIATFKAELADARKSHETQLESFRTWAGQRELALMEREDGYRSKIATLLVIVKDWVKEISMQLKIILHKPEETPAPKKMENP